MSVPGMVTWRDYVPIVEMLDAQGRRAIRNRFMGAFAQFDNDSIRRFDAAVEFVNFRESPVWRGPDDVSKTPHTSKCIETYARTLDAIERDRAQHDMWMALWGKTRCKTCHGYGFVGGSAGTFYEPPEPPEVCETCLGHSVGDDCVSQPICPRCGAIGTIYPLDDDFTVGSATVCHICGWTPEQGGEPQGDGAYPECTCP